MTTIAVALQAARQVIAPSEARLLLRHVLGCSAAHLVAHNDTQIDALADKTYFALVARRKQGEPIAYLIQSREFYGRLFNVAPGVLIPRPETELIVDIVLKRHPPPSPPAPLPQGARGDVFLPSPLAGEGPGMRGDANSPLRILDLGTGSGCLAITLALELPYATVTAVDISSAALAIAQENAVQLHADVRWVVSNWFSSLANEQFDLIVSNPPYIPTVDPHLTQGDLRFEPSGALASGSDGLDAIRYITQNAQHHLSPGGLLLFEHGYDQAESARTLLEANDFEDIEQHHDLAGIMRVSGGRQR